MLYALLQKKWKNIWHWALYCIIIKFFQWTPIEYLVCTRNCGKHGGVNSEQNRHNLFPAGAYIPIKKDNKPSI